MIDCWALLATITWGSPYILYFLLIMVVVNIIMLTFKRMNTLDVDIFDIWHLLFVGLLAKQGSKESCALAFTAGVCLELFSMIGAWFIAAVEPLSQGITNFVNKRLKGCTLNIGLDWPFIVGRAEMWAAANILAPIMLSESLTSHYPYIDGHLCGHFY